MGNSPQLKPAVKSTEFYFMLVAQLAAIVLPLLVAELDKSAAPWALALGAVLTGVNAGLYHWQRQKGKSSKGENEMLRGQLSGLLAAIAGKKPSADYADDTDKTKEQQ